MRRLFAVLAALPLLCAAASAQQTGGVLKIIHRDSPGSLSILEETTNSVVTPMMSVFNNLVLFDQHTKQNSQESIVPELAESWSWNEAGTDLTFRLRDGVRWHDGKPFSSADVECTWDLLKGGGPEKLRTNPREGWYANLTNVSAADGRTVTFHLKRPQPSFLTFLATGFSPIYPCHVPPSEMRTRPIGTGPFRFAQFRRNESIHVTRNPDYWKPDRPYLDEIEFTVIPHRSTAILAFVSGRFDMTFPYEITVPFVKDITSEALGAVCEIAPNNVSTNVLINRAIPPFDNPGIAHAIDLALDRKAFSDLVSEGQNDDGGAMLPPPEGIWGLPPEMLRTLPGHDEDTDKNRAAARASMEGLGFGPDNRLPVKIATRNVAAHRDPAIVLIDQLKQIYIDGEMELIESSLWGTRLARRDFVLALNLTGSAADDPDVQFYENYLCDAKRNFGGFCDRDIDAMIHQQSAELDQAKRREMVWEIDRRLQEVSARPIVYHARSAACMQPWVKNVTIMVNSMYNGWRFEDAWVEK